MSDDPGIPPKDKMLAGLPSGLRRDLFKAFDYIVSNYRDRRWEPSELNGGKLCEVAYSILNGHVAGKFPSRATKPTNMVDACRALENAPKSFPRTVRIQIPRLLIALYEIRNNRGVGHVGGDVDPNEMDATVVVFMSKWIVAELVRLFHGLETEEAQRVVEALVERTLPTIWIVDGKYRVLDTSLSMKQKTLLILYQHGGGPVSETDLCNWVEHSNPSVFRRDVLRKAHAEKLLEYDGDKHEAWLSPKGARLVEDELSFAAD